MSDWDGFLKGDLECEKCGKELSGKNGSYPAETYAGSYTGLCKDCQNEGAYVVKEYFDGAKKISHPPLWTSTGRCRDTFKAYDDCDECDGDGMNIIHKSFRDGGKYRAYCEECAERFREHPLRKARDEMEDKFMVLHTAWEDDFQEKIEDIDDEDKKKEIAEEIWDKIHEDRDKVYEVIKRRFEEAKDMGSFEGIEHIKDAEDEIMELDLNKEYW